MNLYKSFLYKTFVSVAIISQIAYFSHVKADDAPLLGNGTITVIKHVINDNGGSKTAGNFSITAVVIPPLPGVPIFLQTFPGEETGTVLTPIEGSFNITETEEPAYQASYSGCSGTLASGDDVTCTITNTSKPGKVKVVVNVTNDNSGTKAAPDFTVNLTATSPVLTTFVGSEAGVTSNINSGAYGVTLVSDGGYAYSYSADCNSTVSNGEEKTCTVTVDDLENPEYTLTVTKNGDGTGTVNSSDEGINCGEDCSQTYVSGTEVTLTATPDSGSTFADTWTSGPCIGSNNPICTFVITGNLVANAHFSLTPPSGGGSGGGGSGGGSGGGPAPSSGGSGVPTPPSGGSGGSSSGQVAGVSTSMPANLNSLPVPMPVGEVKGAATSLPVTGPVSALAYLGVLAGSFVTARKFGRKFND
ncbi:MAG: hypothetical protein JNN11_01470 [Candidatus Doudnabacteria bacterium]|nr:hypothetical protein [Candidatus Doudnabacteria bacterium]